MNQSRTKRHSRFERPPVVEVALGVQFQPLVDLGVPQLGMLWARFRDRFPKVEHQTPLSHEIERKGVRPQNQPSFQLFEANAGLVPRIWMISGDGTELVQVQQDRFVRNWRRHGDGTGRYPEFLQHLRPAFVEDLGHFLSFVQSEKVGDVVFDQCDLTYVSRIEPSGVWTGPADCAKVFPGLSVATPQNAQMPLEAIGFRARHELLDESGNFVGRLHIQIDSAVTSPTAEMPEPQPQFILQLIARGTPMGSGMEGIQGFLDLGHDAIVTTFENITSDAMQQAWGKIS